MENISSTVAALLTELPTQNLFTGADPTQNLFTGVDPTETVQIDTTWHWSSTAFKTTFNDHADKGISFLLWLCMVWGSFNNLLALAYFIAEVGKAAKKGPRFRTSLYFSFIYMLIAAVDLVICATVLPVWVSYMFQREAIMFGNSFFCAGWGFLWEVLPYISVYLVAVMAVSRAKILAFPLGQVCPKQLISWSILYTLFCITTKILPLIVTCTKPWYTGPYGYFWYNKDSVYCFLYPVAEYWQINSAQSAVQLGIPVPIIISSCVVCLAVIQRLRNRCGKLNCRNQMSKKTPTLTILTICAVYILCNIPVFVNYVLYAIAWIKYNKYTAVYNNTLLYWYSWSITYVVCVCINSAINPIVLLVRMKCYREYCKEKIWRSVKKSNLKKSQAVKKKANKDTLETGINKITITALVFMNNQAVNT